MLGLGRHASRDLLRWLIPLLFAFPLLGCQKKSGAGGDAELINGGGSPEALVSAAHAILVRSLRLMSVNYKMDGFGASSPCIDGHPTCIRLRALTPNQRTRAKQFATCNAPSMLSRNIDTPITPITVVSTPLTNALGKPRTMTTTPGASGPIQAYDRSVLVTDILTLVQILAHEFGHKATCADFPEFTTDGTTAYSPDFTTGEALLDAQADMDADYSRNLGALPVLSPDLTWGSDTNNPGFVLFRSVGSIATPPPATGLANTLHLENGLIAERRRGNGFVIASAYQVLSPADAGVAVASFDAYGRPDTAYGTNGVATVRVGPSFTTGAIAFADDDRLYIVGSTKNGANEDAVIARLSADGKSLDTSFNTTGSVSLNVTNNPYLHFSDVAVHADGRVSAIGTICRANPPVLNGNAVTGGCRFLVARFLANGHADLDFGDDGTTEIIFTATRNAYGLSGALDGDMLYVTGRAYTSGNYSRAALARLLADGSLDTDFAVGGRSMELGSATSTNHEAANRVVLIDKGGKKVPLLVGSVNGLGMLLMYDAKGGKDGSFGNRGYVASDLGSGTTSDADQFEDVVWLPFPKNRFAVLGVKSGGVPNWAGATSTIVYFDDKGMPDKSIEAYGRRFFPFNPTTTTSLAPRLIYSDRTASLIVSGILRGGAGAGPVNNNDQRPFTLSLWP